MIGLYLLGIGLLVGLCTGKVMTDSRWRDAADWPMRVHSGGRLFHVVRDGDARKAREVVGWCSEGAEP